MYLTILFSGLALLAFMHFAFVVGLAKKNNAIIDSFYGLGFVVVIWTAFILMGTYTLMQIITTLLVTLWGFRLFFYVTIRNWGKPEDYRYKAMRERWQDKVVRLSYVKIYLFQSLIIFLVVFPALFINVSETTSINWFFLVGVVIWVIGFYFETIGDYQLYKFKKNPNNRGEILDQGLWKYTQHPNYFGEVTMWWSIFIIALFVPFGYISIFGPILITFMIIKVSGIRLLDKHFEKDDKYADYKKRTSLFFPWFPKKIKKRENETNQ